MTALIYGLVTGILFGFFMQKARVIRYDKQLGALGEGRWDALWGIIGMIVGAAIFAAAFPILKKSILTWWDFGNITLPEIIGVNHWIVIFIFVVCTLSLFGFFEKKHL